VHDFGRRDIHFVLVGGGTEVEAMRRYAQDLGVAEFVTFTGRISDEALLTALSGADICVNPDPVNAMNDKSTMNKIMEYMALAKPIVQFEMTEGRYSAQDASLYAAPNDELDFARKIIQLLEDPAMRQRMGALGAARVRDHLAWTHQIDTLRAAYERALSSRG
jgi:glycosyltransferase involved in cell wall biosynthesis